MADEIDLEKQQIRKAFRRGRQVRDEGQRSAASEALTEQLITLARSREIRSCSCYLSMPGEPDTSGFLAWAREEGIDVLLPVTREDGLLDWVRPSGEGTVTGLAGVPEPLGTPLSPIAVGEVDLMLIPACAIDRRGVRLGWGLGYFDKSLGSMDRRPPVFAVVYEEEFVEELPRDLHDVPVTGVVTPERIEYLDLGDE